MCSQPTGDLLKHQGLRRWKASCKIMQCVEDKLPVSTTAMHLLNSILPRPWAGENSYYQWRKQCRQTTNKNSHPSPQKTKSSCHLKLFFIECARRFAANASVARFFRHCKSTDGCSLFDFLLLLPCQVSISSATPASGCERIHNRGRFLLLAERRIYITMITLWGALGRVHAASRTHTYSLAGTRQGTAAIRVRIGSNLPFR